MEINTSHILEFVPEKISDKIRQTANRLKILPSKEKALHRSLRPQIRSSLHNGIYRPAFVFSVVSLPKIKYTINSAKAKKAEMKGAEMKRKANKILSMMLTLAVGFTMVLGSIGTASAASYDKTKAAFEKCGDYIYKAVKEPTVASIGGEWVIYGLGHAGYDMSDEYIAEYRSNVEKILREKDGILHEKRFTDYSRVIIGCSAAGIDATDIAGYNPVEALGDFVNVKWLGVNSVIWALIAVDSGKYDIPKLTDSYRYGKLTPKETSRQNSRERMIQYILDNQYSDGGWNIQPKNSGSKGYNAASSVDVTGMAMVALAPYAAKKPAVKKAIDRAIKYLSKEQNKNGVYSFWGSETSESCAQMICALTACGVNPNTDKRFIKNGKSVIDGLMTFYDEKVGGFRHVNEASGGYEPVVNQMATEQAYYALAFFYKSVPSQTTLTKAAKAGSGKLKATWEKAEINTDYVTKKSGKTAEVSGYQIVCSTSSKFTKDVVKTTAGSKTLSKTVTGLKKGKTYYVKVRAYKTVNGKKIYGTYSKVLKCRV